MRQGSAVLCFVGVVVALAMSAEAAAWALAPGSYTANLSPYTLTMVVNSQGIITETFDLTSSKSIAPACGVAAVQGRVGNTFAYDVVAGGEGCSSVFGANGIQLGATSISSTGKLTISYTNKTGTFSAPVVASSRIPDGSYCTGKGAAYPVFITVTDAKYYIGHGTAGLNFACLSTGTIVGGPLNVITIEGTTTSDASVKTCDIGLSAISFAKGVVTLTTTKGAISLSSCNPAWSQKQTYCGTLGAWGVNAIINPDLTGYLQMLPKASAVQPSADYCVLEVYYAGMPDNSFRTFPKGSAGDCAKAFASLGLVKSMTWKGNSLVLATASASSTLQNSQCFAPPLGSYGGSAGGYSASVNVLAGRQYQVMFGVAGKSDMACADFGEFVNSTAAAVFITSSGRCGSVVKAVTALSYASNQFTLSGLDKDSKAFTVVLK